MSEKYKTVLLKLSGEALLGENLKNIDPSQHLNIDPEMVTYLAGEILELVKRDYRLGIVLGGGNIFRGISAASRGINRVDADYMGMLATIINSLALQSALENNGVDVRVLSSIHVNQVCEPFIRRKALTHLDKGRVVIFAGGTGAPYFTTDTTAVLRASEVEADIVLKATKVDGIYCSDPNKNADAKRYDKLTFTEAINNNLQVMDATALAMCRDNNIPLVVFSIFQKGNMLKVLEGDKSIGTIVFEE